MTYVPTTGLSTTLLTSTWKQLDAPVELNASAPILRETLPEHQSEAGSPQRTLCLSFVALSKAYKNIYLCDYLINVCLPS